MQRQNLEDVARAAAVAADDIRTATDGCGVVTFALPLDRMARMFASLTSSLEGRRVADAMRAHPEYIRGAGATDTVLMQSITGAVAKGGAEGLICGVRRKTGFALKAPTGTTARCVPRSPPYSAN
jgi:L-asparaginase II